VALSAAAQEPQMLSNSQSLRCSASHGDRDSFEFPCVTSDFGAAVGSASVAYPLISPPSDSAHCGSDFKLEPASAVLVRRGGCSFSAKALVSERMGARVVVVVNDREGDPIPMGSMPGDDLPIDSLSMMIGQRDGDRLAAMLADTTTNGLTFTVHPVVTAPKSDADQQPKREVNLLMMSPRSGETLFSREVAIQTQLVLDTGDLYPPIGETCVGLSKVLAPGRYGQVGDRRTC
jgi:hypothetical protein